MTPLTAKKGSSYDYRSDLWGHLKRVKAASFSQSLKSMKRKAEGDFLVNSFKNLAIGKKSKGGVLELSNLVKKLRLGEGKTNCPDDSSQESSYELCSRAKTFKVSSQCVGQPFQEHEVNGNDEQGTHEVLEGSKLGSEQGAVDVHSDAVVFPPVLPLVLEERCDWLEQDDQ